MFYRTILPIVLRDLRRSAFYLLLTSYFKVYVRLLALSLGREFRIRGYSSYYYYEDGPSTFLGMFRDFRDGVSAKVRLLLFRGLFSLYHVSTHVSWYRNVRCELSLHGEGSLVICCVCSSIVFLDRSRYYVTKYARST